jgi:hypothetical protein
MRQPILLVALFLALTVTAAAQQKEAPPSDKEKIEKQRSEHFKKFTAPMLAEEEQRTVIIRDLIQTRIECRALDASYFDAQRGSDQERDRLRSAGQCRLRLEAKLARTPLDTIAPYMQVIKGVDVEMAKWRAINIICDAYEYGLQQAKKPVDKQP